MQIDTGSSTSRGAEYAFLSSKTATRSTGAISKFAVFFILLVLSGLLWVPTGIDVPDIADGLRFFTLVNQPQFVSPSRPFTSIGFWLIYSIGQDWWSVNLGWMITLAIQGWLVYLLAREFSLAAPFSFSLAALSVVFPADQGVFYFGASNIRFALLTFLAASYFLILYWKRRRPLALAGSLFALFLTGGTYELFYPLAFVFPLVVFVLPSRPSGVMFWRRWRRSSILWWMVIGVLFCWTVFTLFVGSAHYQVGLLDRSVTPIGLIEAIGTLYRRIIFDGFITPLNMQLIDIVCALVAAGLTVFMMQRLGSHTTGKNQSSPRAILVVVAGFAIVLLGFVIYLPTTERESAFRTLYMSSIGGAIIFIGAIMWFQQRFPQRRWVSVVACSICVGFACLQLINQHRATQVFAERHRTIARDLASLIPDTDDQRPIIVIEASPTRDFEAVYGGSWYFESSLQIELQNYDVRIGFCYPNRPTWGSFAERCEVDENRIAIFIYEDEVFLSTLRDDARLFTYDGEFHQEG